MNFFGTKWNLLSGRRPSQNDNELREFFSQSSTRAMLQKDAGPDEDFMRSEMLLIFDTRTQHTWLMATSAALYCVIDNRRQPHARKLWRLARSDIERNGKLVLEIVEAPVTDRDHYLIIGKQRPRKISKQLFETLTIKESIENMLENAFHCQIAA